MKLTDAQKNFRVELEEAEIKRIELKIKQLRESKRVSVETYAEIERLEDQLDSIGWKPNRRLKDVSFYVFVIVATFSILMVFFSLSIKSVDQLGNRALVKEGSEKTSIASTEVMVKNKIGIYANNVANPATEVEKHVFTNLYSDDFNTLSVDEKLNSIDDYISDLSNLKTTVINADTPKVLKNYSYMRVKILDYEIESIELYRHLVLGTHTSEHVSRYNQIQAELETLMEEAHSEVIRVFDDIDMVYQDNELLDRISFTYGAFE